MASYAQQLASASPESAAPWALAVSDPNLRMNALENVARTWLQSDHDSAAAWIAQLNVPANVKQGWLRTSQQINAQPSAPLRHGPVASIEN